MIISYPFLPAQGPGTLDDDYERRILDMEMQNSGVYPSGHDRAWHGGVHLLAPNTTEPVRAIADGTLIAYRLNKELIKERSEDAEGRIDNSFVLIRHDTETDSRTGSDGVEQPVEVGFYSLYMHLMNTGDMTTRGVNRRLIHSAISDSGQTVQRGDGAKIYRKDIIGFPGESYSTGGMIHFEIFLTDEDLNGFFVDSRDPAQIGEKGLWGDSYFVVKAGTAAIASHPSGQTIGGHAFATGTAGSVDAAKDLYVRIAFRKGAKYTTTWSEGDAESPSALLTVEDGVADDGYEYAMYSMATALYPSCPSAGMELLRFGKVIGPDKDKLAENEKHNWQPVTYADGKQGYIDLADPNLVSGILSDADFPNWLGWQKTIGGTFTDTAQCNMPALLDTLKVSCDEESVDASQLQLSDYFSDANNQHLRPWTKKLIAQFPSEWDRSNNDRYTKLKQKDGIGPGLDGPFLDDEDEYKKHIEFVEKLQWWDDAGLGDSNVWHFHPFGFIKHFRKCGWLTQSELAQCIPRRNKYLRNSDFVQEVVATWSTARHRTRTWNAPLSEMTRKYGISGSKQRLLHFLSQAITESAYFRLVKEGEGEHQSYSPWYGRGLIQLTFPHAYKAYGDFRKFPLTETGSGKYSEVGWDPDTILALNDKIFNVYNCADSAGFYWTCPLVTANRKNGLAVSDVGFEVSDIINVSKLVNGDVANEKINGLDIRIQTGVWLKYVLSDGIAITPEEEVIFTWRRSSSREAVLDAGGHPVVHHGHLQKKFYLKNHLIGALLQWQRP